VFKNLRIIKWLLLIKKRLFYFVGIQKDIYLGNRMNDKYISSVFLPISELNATLGDFISDYFNFHKKDIEIKINPFIDLLRNDLVCFFEYPYVEKVYRDSYYSYYSTKHNAVLRNSARISFFSNNISSEDFRSPERFEQIQKSFFGYITIRPTLPNIIGRTMLSPLAFKSLDTVCCITETKVTINGVKLKIRAFPHSSQDGETITCAETTIWSVMEYFGSKYDHYKPILPSRIVAALSKFTVERQLPSRGLTAEQISFALKEFDLSVRLYSQTSLGEDGTAFKELEFKRFLGYYIQSGFPVIVAVENVNIGHAMVIIGHRKINHIVDITKNKYEVVKTQTGCIKLYDYVDLIEEYVVIDDNMPPYNLVPFEDPTKNYNSPQFEKCNIRSFVVPLYHKIYLEAGGAKALLVSYLEQFEHNLPGQDIIFKLFCMTSRSFKAELNKYSDIGIDANDLIQNLTMPKFIWLGVFTNPLLIRNSKANGLIVLDATETSFRDVHILMVTPKGVIINDTQSELGEKYPKIKLKVNNFNIFANNLKEN
jgi:hypothetical protein